MKKNSTCQSVTIHAFTNLREVQSSLVLSPVLHSWEKLHFLAIVMTFYYKSKNIFFFSIRQPIEIIYKFSLCDTVVFRKVSCSQCPTMQGTVHDPTKTQAERKRRKEVIRQGHRATQNPKKRMNISFLTTCPMFLLLHHCTAPSARSNKNIMYLLAINIMQEHLITYIIICPQEIKDCCSPQIH